MKNQEQPDLKKLRAGIMAVDAELVRLLNQRAAFSLAVGELKRAHAETGARSENGPGKDAQGAIFRPVREADILRHLETLCDGPLPKAHLQAIYREILSSSRNLQRPQRVAFSGPEGSPSHIAGIKLLGSLAGFHRQESLEAVFQAVSSEDCEIGIVPLTNTPLPSAALLSAALLNAARNNAAPKNDLPDNALPENASQAGHCLDLFMRYPDICILADTTAGFAVIGPSPADAPGPECKSTVMFSLPDGPGSGKGKTDTPDAVLALLSATGLGLSEPTIRPLPDKAGGRMFFVDIAGNIQAAEHAATLKSVRAKCRTFRILGCYPTLG